MVDFKKLLGPDPADEHIRPAIKARAKNPDLITPKEWDDLHTENGGLNSYEQEFLYPLLDDAAFLEVAEYCIKNCQFEKRRPWRSYNEAVMGFFAPGLLARFRKALGKPTQ